MGTPGSSVCRKDCESIKKSIAACQTAARPQYRETAIAALEEGQRRGMRRTFGRRRNRAGSLLHRNTRRRSAVAAHRQVLLLTLRCHSAFQRMRGREVVYHGVGTIRTPTSEVQTTTVPLRSSLPTSRVLSRPPISRAYDLVSRTNFESSACDDPQDDEQAFERLCYI